MAIMTLVYDGGAKDTFIWHTPHFDSMTECAEWVTNNNPTIYLELKKQFPNDTLDRLLCVREDKLKKFLEEAPVPEGTDI